MVIEQQPPGRPNNKIFVSYAHEDREFVDELTTYLAPGVRSDKLRILDDSQIPPGADWRALIDEMLVDAAVCVLLVSQSFLASDFIAEVELPAIIDRARKNETRLLWIAINHSTVAVSPLYGFQAANDPHHPIVSLSEADRAAAWVKIAREVASATTLNSVARSLSFLDDTAETFEALVEDRSVRLEHEYGVVAGLDRQADVIEFSGAMTTIAYIDLEQLPPSDHEFIQDIEESLNGHYESWRKIRARIGKAAGALDDEVRVELRRVANLICSDLSAILDFLVQIHKVELEDHYGRYRWICSQVQRA